MLHGNKQSAGSKISDYNERPTVSLRLCKYLLCGVFCYVNARCVRTQAQGEPGKHPSLRFRCSSIIVRDSGEAKSLFRT